MMKIILKGQFRWLLVKPYSFKFQKTILRFFVHHLRAETTSFKRKSRMKYAATNPLGFQYLYK